MKKVNRIDSDGYYVEPVMINDNDIVPAECVADVIPAGLNKPQYVNGVWVEGMAQADILVAVKTTKKASLSQLCNDALVGGFKSAALGTEHIYPSHDKAQNNFNTVMNRFSTDPTYTECKFYTEDAGWLVHTKDQFYKAFNDGHDYGDSQWDKLFDLYSKVDAAQTQDDVNAITW